MTVLKETFAVLFQKNDYIYTRDVLEDAIKKLETCSVSPTEDIKVKRDFIKAASENIKTILLSRAKEIIMWRAGVPGLIYAWFKLTFDYEILESDIYYIFMVKYSILLIGIFMSWSFIKTLSLKSQQHIFALDCIIEGYKLLEIEFSFAVFEREYFYNPNGMTKYFSSSTKQHIRQIYYTIFIFICLIVLSIHRDWEFLIRLF